MKACPSSTTAFQPAATSSGMYANVGIVTAHTVTWLLTLYVIVKLNDLN